jgi:hypothetical protein
MVRETDIKLRPYAKGGEGMLQYLGLFDILWVIWQSITRKKEKKLEDKVKDTGHDPILGEGVRS